LVTKIVMSAPIGMAPSALTTSVCGPSAFASGAPIGTSASGRAVVTPRTVALAEAKTWTLKAMTSSAALTFRADNARNGAGADPAMTYLSGTVWG
jgi:hypothetical protein